MGRVLVLLALHELDPVIDEIRVEVLDLLLRQLDFLETRDDLVVREETLLDAVCNELVKLFDVRQSDVYGEHVTSAFSAGRGLTYLPKRKRAGAASASGSPVGSGYYKPDALL